MGKFLRRTAARLSLGLALLLSAAPAGEAAEADREMIATSPLLLDGILYTASFTRPAHAGHLRALDLNGISPRQLWDAAARMPTAGTGASPGDLATSDPPLAIDPANLYRSLFANLPGRNESIRQPFTPLAATTLLPALQVAGIDAARALINRVRGRAATSVENVDGTGEASSRLWGISRSSPAVVGRRAWLVAVEPRPRVIYVGAEDGQLHAFHAGDWDTGENRYDSEAAAAGRELWAYLPGHLLCGLADQPFDAEDDGFAVHVDGSPAVGDVHADWNGDGRRQWRTLLVGTATLAAEATGLAFGLDVTDPLQPALLWENPLPGANAGRTRGAVLASIDNLSSMPAAFLTTSLAEPADPAGVPEPVNGRFGIRACALDPVSGQPLWEWQALYPPPATEVRAIPAAPALLDSDGDTLADAMVFGDMAGRLWVIDAITGQPWGDGPAYQVEGGGSQPIGAGVTVHGRLVVFGTGGAEHADPAGQYAIYGVEILPTGAQLRWSYPLAPGEQVWSAPVIDRLGRIYFAVSQNYRPDDPTAWDRSAGRLVILDRDGLELVSTPTDSAVAGRVRVAPGTALAVTLSGQVFQFGAVRRQPAGQDSWQGALQLFSWRVR